VLYDPNKNARRKLTDSKKRANQKAAARVAEWQTRWTQNPVLATVCGFKSLLGHSFHLGFWIADFGFGRIFPLRTSLFSVNRVGRAHFRIFYLFSAGSQAVESSMKSGLLALHQTNLFGLKKTRCILKTSILVIIYKSVETGHKPYYLYA
jgi:hypothetical protein